VGDRMNLWYVGATSIIQCSKTTQILRIFTESCGKFYKVLTSISSSKTELGAKRYRQNTEGRTATQDDPTLHKMTLSVHSTVYLNWPLEQQLY
jgi:hypothetical protein